MSIKKTTFTEFAESKLAEADALVFLGCGGDLKKWVSGISGILTEENIMKPDSEWFVLKTTGGRTDLVCPLNDTVNLAKLAMWRLRFGDCSWWSDYAVNYADHHAA